MPLQRVQNAGDRLIRALGPRDHVTSTLCDSRWLPLSSASFTNCVRCCMHVVNTGHIPQYLCDFVSLLLALDSALQAHDVM